MTDLAEFANQEHKVDPLKERVGFRAAAERWPTFQHCPECGGRLYLTFPEEGHIGGHIKPVRLGWCFCKDEEGNDCPYQEKMKADQISALIGLYAEFENRYPMLQVIQLLELGYTATFALDIVNHYAEAADEAATIASVMNAGAKQAEMEGGKL